MSGKHMLSSAARGYGVEHQRRRREALAAFTSGDPCGRCGQPMLDPPELLDLDHTDDRSDYLGLSHRSCNRRHTRAPIGKHQRVCDGCGVPYVAKSREQRYCTQACYRRQPKPPRPKRALKPKPVKWPRSSVWFRTREGCSRTFAARKSVTRFCSSRCYDAAYNATRRRPRVESHDCTDCGNAIPPTRHKCDACLLDTKRERKRRERKSEGHKRRERERDRRRRAEHKGGAGVHTQVA